MRLDLLDTRERSLVVLRWSWLEAFGDNMRVTFRHPRVGSNVELLSFSGKWKIQMFETHAQYPGFDGNDPLDSDEPGEYILG
jgi:hypothetical protein